MDFSAGLATSLRDQESVFSRRIDYHVDAVLGNDLNDGSFLNPFQTFQHAVNMADETSNPGNNNIFLNPGVYDSVLINDDDLLMVFGQGQNIWDVSVTGDSAGSTIRIEGGKDVRLFNLRASGSESSGIYARDLDYLFLKEVMSQGHDGDGFYGTQITRTKIYHSYFTDNGRYGAHLEDGDFFRSVASHFDQNQAGGIGLENINRAWLVASTAGNNGQDIVKDSQVANAADGPSGSGLSAYDLNELVVVGGHYNSNAGYGILAQRIGKVHLAGTGVVGNQAGGATVNFHESAQVDGGLYSNNLGTGLQLTASTTETAQLVSETQQYAGVYGSHFLNNSRYGLEINQVQQVMLVGVDSRLNGYSGAMVAFASYLNVVGGFLYQNKWNGVTLDNVYASLINDLTSKNNGQNGLYLRGGYRANIMGGAFCHNELWGINAGGLRDSLLQRIDVKHATVLGNWGGLFVAYAYLGKLVGGTFSQSLNNGVYMTNVLRGIFYHIVVKLNGDYGLRFDAGQRYQEDQAALETNSRLADDHGSNWNQVDFLGGFYCDNGYDGIYIATQEDRRAEVNMLKVNADFVVARDNGYIGFNVGRSMDEHDAAAAYGNTSNLYLTMQGGYYSYNGTDGIYLLGTDNQDPVVGKLRADVVDVVAEYNGQHGVNGSGLVTYHGGTALEHPNDATSQIRFQRGFYGFNQQDGINLSLTVVPSTVPGYDEEENQYASIAVFNHVVASDNEGTGLRIDAFVRGNDDVSNSATTDEKLNDHLNASPIRLLGGVYNRNREGIRITSDTDFGNDVPTVAAVSLFDISLEDVVANANAGNGLTVENHRPDVFRPNVEILRGVYNVNENDGVFLSGLGDIAISSATIVANEDDGVHSRNNSGLTTTGSLIKYNLVEDIHIEP